MLTMSGRSVRRIFALGAVLLATQPLYAAPTSALTAVVNLPVASVESVFYVAKSENRNQVHYAIRVDESCRPVGKRPVYGYWRELERGPRVTSLLLDREQPGYGASEARNVVLNDHGGELQLSLRAIKRPIAIATFRTGSGCAARATVMIQKQPAVLTSIYVDLGLLMSVNYALVRGVRVSDGKEVSEKLYREPSR